MQRAAQSILNDRRPRIDKFGQERAHFKYRVAMCHRGTDGVAPEIRRMETGERAEFFGVQTCGSVWHCPICAAKIATERRDQMRAAMAEWFHRQQRGVYLGNYTFQHTAEEGGAGCLDAQLDKLRTVMRKFTASRAYKAVMEDAGSVGAIRALEVTYGELNGWHPHVHQLIFAEREALQTDQRRGHVGQTIYRRSILGRLRKLWAQHLIKAGMAGLSGNETPAERFAKLRHLLTRCFTVQCGGYADDYIAKFGREGDGWGMADELAKGHMKTPRRCSRVTPWGLLCDYLDGDKRASWLFREYADAFQGKRQLFWSKGLAETLGVAGVEKGDDEIAATPEMRCAETVIKLSDDQWELILTRNARYDVLKVAAQKGRMGVLVFLDELRECEPTHSGHFTRTSQAFIPLRR